MAIEPKPTLGELVRRVAVRTGYAAQGGASVVQKPILVDFVQSAQRQLIEQLQEAVLYQVNTTDPGNLAVGQTLYDIPSDCDPTRIEHVTVLSTAGDRALSTLHRGIDTINRVVTTPSIPSRWEVRIGTSDKPQLEVWPPPNQAYPIVLEYFLKVGRFREDDDPVTIPDELVFLHALTNAKAHYGQKGGDTLGAQLDAMLYKLKAKLHKGRRYFKRGYSSATGPMPMDFASRMEWVTQTGKVINDIDVLLSEQGEYLIDEN